MTVVLYSYHAFSLGAKNLARALNIKRIKHANSRFVARPRDTVINWGSSSLPPSLARAGRVVNDPESVRIASDKLRFLQRMSEHNVPVPEWTTDRNVAADWINNGNMVVARTILNSHSARGLVIVDPGLDDLPNAPLYTKYFKKKHEYRIHVGFGEIVDVQRKARRQDVEDDEVNWRVRNLDGGFIYARHAVDLPGVVQDVTNAAVNALPELTFGAYDVIYNEHNNLAVVLEVNTAPGITGTTVENYANMFKDHLW